MATIGVRFEIGNLRVLAREYRKLPSSLAKKHLKAAIRKSAKKFEPTYRSSAIKGKNQNLRKSVKTIVFFGRREDAGQWVAKVGYARGKGKKGGHAILLNDGTKDRYTKQRAYRGRGPKTGFGDRAMSAVASMGPADLGANLAAALQKALKELPRYLQHRRRV